MGAGLALRLGGGRPWIPGALGREGDILALQGDKTRPPPFSLRPQPCPPWHAMYLYLKRESEDADWSGAFWSMPI